MELKELERLKEKWEEGVMMYRAGIHPNQEKITKALIEYVLAFGRG